MKNRCFDDGIMPVMNVPFISIVSVILASGAIHAAPAGPTPSAKATNILFILADQWRAHAFGYAGDPNVRTPNIDRLEKQSVNFTQAVAGMPVCSPTRATLLTGQSPQTHGIFINDAPLNPEVNSSGTISHSR